MDRERREEILRTQRTDRWQRGEPHIGGYYGEEEIEVVVRTIRDSMDPNEGFGFICEEIEQFERQFGEFCNASECVSINGAGTGLDMAMMCLDLQPGDEVIVPAINFPGAALSVIGQGGQVVWCEVDPRTFQADPEDVERRITPRTRAIYPVHMNGMAAPIDDYLEIAGRHPHPQHGPLMVIGDAARSCGAGYKGQKIGGRAWMTIFSFHTMKNMTTLGEGGAVTTNDPEAAERLRAIRQFGGGGKQWGTNYKLTKVQAAVGLVQLARLDTMLEQRRNVAYERNELLAGVEELTLPYEPADCWHTYYLYTCLVPEAWAGAKRDRIIAVMADDYGVGCVVANPPNYLSNAFLARMTEGQRLPLSEQLGGRLLCVSMHPTMTTEDNEYICAALETTIERVREEG
jgi:dTDP-4-amino-4,6-dideoxygalactose transaminase